MGTNLAFWMLKKKQTNTHKQDKKNNKTLEEKKL